MITGNYYHIFNRGVNKAPIFLGEGDYSRFHKTAIHYLSKKVKYSSILTFSDTVSERNDKVQVLAYCLMPNHFHFLVKQIADNGITDYFRHLLNAYSHYINVKYKRVGPLFQGPFKSILVASDEQLLHLSRYIHLNPLVSGLVSDLEKYPLSSYLSYLGHKEDLLNDSSFIRNRFKSGDEYARFVLDQADYARELDRVKHLLADHDI